MIPVAFRLVLQHGMSLVDALEQRRSPPQLGSAGLLLAQAAHPRGSCRGGIPCSSADKPGHLNFTKASKYH